MNLTPFALCAFYGFFAVLTFGHSAANNTCNLSSLSEMDCDDFKTTAGILAGAFWPLYWSWEAFEVTQ